MSTLPILALDTEGLFKPYPRVITRFGKHGPQIWYSAKYKYKVEAEYREIVKVSKLLYDNRRTDYDILLARLEWFEWWEVQMTQRIKWGLEDRLLGVTHRFLRVEAARKAAYAAFGKAVTVKETKVSKLLKDYLISQFEVSKNNQLLAKLRINTETGEGQPFTVRLDAENEACKEWAQMVSEYVLNMNGARGDRIKDAEDTELKVFPDTGVTRLWD